MYIIVYYYSTIGLFTLKKKEKNFTFKVKYFIDFFIKNSTASS